MGGAPWGCRPLFLYVAGSGPSRAILGWPTSSFGPSAEIVTCVERTASPIERWRSEFAHGSKLARSRERKRPAKDVADVLRRLLSRQVFGELLTSPIVDLIDARTVSSTIIIIWAIARIKGC
jgi:hypothetical protein